MNRKKVWLEWVPMGVCAVAILTCAFVFGQKWYKVLPTLNTLVILLLSARVDRRSFLLGGLNAALYGIGYLGEGLYFSVINCLLVSMPLQLFSFFHQNPPHRNTATAPLMIKQIKKMTKNHFHA